MSLPRDLDRKIQLSFDELIVEVDVLYSELHENLDDISEDLSARYEQWIVKTSSLLHMLFGDTKQEERYRQIIETYSSDERYFDGPVRSSVRRKAATLKGVRDSYVNGFYISLEEQAIANVSADYMDQAESLLDEGIQGQNDHVPAAVLCGAVLEDALRRLCQKQTPPIDIVKSNGDKKTLEPLIQDLQRAKVFNKSVADQLRAWTKIRNYAAHGEFSEFTREQVDFMLPGVKQFLALHM